MKDRIKILLITLVGTVAVVSASCLAACGLSAGLAELLNLATAIAYGGLVMLVAHDVGVKMVSYPELVVPKYWAGVAIEVAAIEMFFAAWATSSAAWARLFLAASVVLAVGVFAYDRYVYDVVVSNRKELFHNREDRLLLAFLAKAKSWIAKNPDIGADAQADYVAKGLYGICRFHFRQQGDMSQRYDFSKPFDEDDLCTYDELYADEGKDEALAAKKKAFGLYLSNAAKVYVGSVRAGLGIK